MASSRKHRPTKLKLNINRQFAIHVVMCCADLKTKLYKMELQELKQTDWYKERPTIVKNAIDLLPPTKMYRFKNSKKQCHLISYEEPESKKLDDVTVTVQKTGVGGAMDEMALGILDTNQVFGVKLTDLEEWTD